jgi:hypothetical protein
MNLEKWDVEAWAGRGLTMPSPVVRQKYFWDARNSAVRRLEKRKLRIDL